MGNRVTIKQNDFSNGMQSDVRNKNLVGQTQVFGAEKVKHFDIYQTGKLKPQPSFERFNTDDEVDYGITVVGGKDGSTVYGLGLGMDSWLAPQYTYRIELTADETSSEADFHFIDLSQLSDNFWDNVATDGSDIRIGTNDNAKTFIYNFDSVLKTGYAVSNIHEIQDCYLYFGDSNSSLMNKDYSVLFNSDLFIAAPFDGTTIDYTSTSVNFSDGTATYGGGRIGQGLTGTPQNQNNAVANGDEVTISMMVDYTLGQADGGVLSITPFIFSPDGNVRISIGATGLVSVYVDTQGGTINQVGSEVLNDGWNSIITTYNETTGLRTYINGVLDISTSSDLTGISSGTEYFKISANYFNSAEFFTFKRNSYKSDARQIAEGKMLTDSSFWAEGSLETFSSHTPTFSGIGIYEKDINGTNWVSAVFDGVVIKDTNASVYPIPAFIDYDDGYFFLTSQDSDMTGILYGARAGYGSTLLNVDDFDNILALRREGQVINTVTLASDKEHYITDSGALDVYAPIEKAFKYNDLSNVEQSQLYEVGYSAVVYDAYPSLTSSVRYGYNLAVAGTRNSRGSIEIWDLINLDPETVVDIGTGNTKVLANVKGSLVAVVDNYLQDEGLSRGEPTLDFRLWQGGENMRTIQSFVFDHVDTTYTNNWEYAIDNRRSDLHNASVFVAEPATDWKGLWAIGSGDKGTLGVSILYETESIGRIDTHHSIGNNLIIIKNDGDIYKLNSSGDYDQTSEFTSMIFDAGVQGVKKDIVGMEISLDKDLPAGQVITLSYSVDGGSFETVGVCTDKVTEFSLANGAGFNNFNELQIKITSTGGNAVITEYAIKVEYEDELL